MNHDDNAERIGRRVRDAKESTVNEEIPMAPEELPPCLRCGETDRMILWGFDTDFDGHVDCYCCQRCGTVAVAVEGERPPHPACRVCACTDEAACFDDTLQQACHWVEFNLCSTCASNLSLDEAASTLAEDLGIDVDRARNLLVDARKEAQSVVGTEAADIPRAEEEH